MPPSSVMHHHERPSIERLPGNPIIRPEMDPGIGTNINGPSLIRIPDWLPSPLGRYYLYFAHHRAGHIRLAFADELCGPWRIHSPGTLHLAQTPFEDHIASPDIHVDHGARRILMYYHGGGRAGAEGQETWLATSADGLAFETLAGPLGRAYWRTFKHGGFVYALEMPGLLLRGLTPEGPFERGPEILPRSARHSAVLVRGDTLHVFWSAIGDHPERILHAAVDLRGDWRGWQASRAVTLLRPREPWEGATLPCLPSQRGIAREQLHQLRDPCIYEEHGHSWMLYAVAGESGLAIARVTAFTPPRPSAILLDSLHAAGGRVTAALRASGTVKRVRALARHGLESLRDTVSLLQCAPLRKAWRIRKLDQRPVLVVGCGRSGTTLMITLLGTQPGIAAIPGETEAFMRNPPREGRRVIWRHLSRMELPTGAHRWAEKTPRHVRYLGKILALYGPRIRIILMVRDGRDVVTSHHGTRHSHRYYLEPGRWINDVTAGRAWDQDPRVITVRYEDLVADPAATMRRICTFLGEEVDEAAALHFHAHASDDALAFLNIVGEPPAARLSGARHIVDSSAGRWRRLTGDPAIETLMADPRAIDLLRHYGYLESTEVRDPRGPAFVAADKGADS